MYQTDLIALAGGYNVASEIEDSYWVDISYEQVLAWDPEYIILTSDADYTVEDVLNNENLVSCKAVVNGNVYQMPSKAGIPGSKQALAIRAYMTGASVRHHRSCCSICTTTSSSVMSGAISCTRRWIVCPDA